MFYNYLKIAFRNLLRHRSFSLLNLAGLTLGTICCLYIVMYVRSHQGYDSHHQDTAQIFRVTSHLELGGDGKQLSLASCSPPIAPAMQATFPEVKVATRACKPMGMEQQLLSVGEKTLFAPTGYFVDSTFFEVLDYHFVEGDEQTALDEPFTAVLSANLAQKLFGKVSAVGQSVEIGTNGESNLFQVKGVIDHSLGKSHLDSELFMSMNSAGLGQFIRSNSSWAGNNFVYSYIRLQPDANVKSLSAKLPDFLIENGGDQIRDAGMKKSLVLQPITDIHTQTELDADQATNTSSSFLSLLLLIAGFIQLVACINFMNLMTARASRRAREVGVRKTVGASRGSLLGQFLVESCLLAVLAVALAVPLTQFCLPFLNQLTGTELQFEFNGSLFGLLLGLSILTGIIAGSYPAIYLSSFEPVRVLNGLRQNNGAASWFRQGLVVSQMVIAAVLIIAAFVIHLQLNFLLEKDLGFDQHQKIVFDLQTVTDGNNTIALRDAMKRMASVENVSTTDQVPGQRAPSDMALYGPGKTMNEASLVLISYADENLFETLDIELLAGRKMTLADTATELEKMRVIVNQTTLDRQGIRLEDAPGTVLRSDFEDNHFEATIVGVMADFHFQNLTDELQPAMILVSSPRYLEFLIADVKTTDYEAFLAQAKTTWESILPDVPFAYSFLDEDIAQLYENERTLSGIIGTFTVLAIFIACLGLFGLSAYAAEQRRKEISVRKILGASVQRLVGLLSKEFLVLAIVALVVATPVAYFLMNYWLADFAYRTPLYWWIFALAGLFAVGIALFTISFQAIRAALVNPVESLRGE